MAQPKGLEQPRAKSLEKSLENHIFPILGKRPINEITTMDLLIPLRKMEDKGVLETASRNKQRMNAIMRYAVQNGMIKYNPAQELNGAIETNKTKHRPALPL